jgi:transglutaminase superfamily protein
MNGASTSMNLAERIAGRSTWFCDALIACAAAIICAAASGCSDETSATSLVPLSAAIGGRHSTTDESTGNPLSSTQNSAQGHPRETWDALYLAGVKVGYCRTRLSEIVEDDQKLTRIDSTSSLTVNRAAQRTEHTIVSTSVETPTGQLMRFHTRLQSGSTPTDFSGYVDGNELVVETETSGKATTSRQPWPAGAGGFLAMEQSLLRQPMVPGERRVVTGLLAVVNQPIAIELTAEKVESAKLLEHSEDLLRIECRAQLPDGTSVAERLWANRNGTILKRRIEALHQVTYRVTKERALEEIGPARFDLMLDTTVPADRALVDPHGTRRIRYRVHLKTNDPAQVFARGNTQEVVPLDPHTAEIVVRAVRPHAALDKDSATGNNGSQSVANPVERPDSKSRMPTEDDREPNNLIQSDNPKIVTMARSILPRETDPWEIAVQIERIVKKHIRRTDYSQAFASAADVVEQGEGDCTEHAVLLAALCRARGIPARVAIGLVYVPAAQGFGYHMWNEVWIDGAWIPLDATLARGGIGAAHLKLTDSSLKGTSAFSTFLAVAQVIGQLKIEVLEVE